jgi:ZIP family zinc transporter
MEAAGFQPRQQFWAAVLTSAPQPVGALIAYALVQEISALLPFSFAFAAGAMLCLVAVELAPEAFKRGTLRLSLAGTAAGAAAMLALASVLGV